MDNFTTNIDKSEFNVNFHYLLAINNLLIQCNALGMTEDYLTYSKLLNRVYINISPVLSKEEKINQNEMALRITNILIKPNNEVYIKEIMGALNEYEVFLRRVCYDHDLILTRKAHAGVAIGRGD